jgi:mannose-6-phosphate isomerase-like protein (cupin superfamily)
VDRSLHDILEESGAPLDALVDALDEELSSDAGPMSPTGRARLLEALEGTHRFDDLEEQVAELLDVDVPAVSRMLLDVDRVGVWEGGPNPSCTIFHVDGGPAVRDAVTGFVKILPGGGFPPHEHLGDEIVLVLQGAFRDITGTVVGAGQTARMPSGSSHSFEVEGDLPLVYLAVVQRGVIIGGMPILAGDPRA